MTKRLKKIESFEEYQKRYFPKSATRSKRTSSDAVAFGNHLAKEALQKVEDALSKRWPTAMIS